MGLAGQHHPKGFGNWCRPEHVVISGSRDVEEIDAIEAVKRSYQQIGCEVYHTAELGSIRFEITAAGLKVETYRQAVK